MRILIHINFINSLGADRWIGSGYKDAFEDLGHQVFWLSSSDDLKKRIGEIKPDILFIGMERFTYKNVPILKRARKNGTKIVLSVDSFFEENKEVTEVLTKYNLANLYRGETEGEWMKRFTEITGKSYVTTPNAAHHRYHFPAKPNKKYDCDITFLGANLPLKRKVFEQLLSPLKKKYRVKIYGPGWTLKDNFLRLSGYTARKFGLRRLNEWINRRRITVPVEEENQLYSSAKISVNLHEERRGRARNHVFLNERTFKIPACGGFEICDFVPGNVLQRYFNEDEVVMAYDSKDWFSKIDYYMNNEKERRLIQEKGTKRALRDHTYLNRVKQIIHLLYGKQGE